MVTRDKGLAEVGTAGALAAAGRLLRTPAALCGGVGSIAVGLGGALFPSLALPGLEQGLATALLFGLALGPWLGLAAARLELARSRAREAPASAVRAGFAAALAATALVLVGLAAGTARAALATRCGPLQGLAVHLLEAWPSAVLASVAGAAAGVVGRGSGLRTALLFAAAVAASVAATALRGYLGPSAAAYDHLLGFWPGPLYDEAVRVDARVLLFRAGTVAWALAAVSAAALTLARRAGRSGARPALALSAALACAVAARSAGGGTPDRRELDHALGAVRVGPRCTVHLARERPPAEAERVLRDCEYDAQAVAAALGLTAAPRVQVWLYRSAAEKRRLVGAGGTSFTKPWLAEIHLQDEGVPHPLLRHELVHALGSAVAGGPLRVPARALVGVNAGLVEGLAVALEVPAGSWDVDQWSRALRDLGKLPELRSLLRPDGFFAAPPARAYAAAGSFLRFLGARYGPAAVRAAYASGDVALATGRPLAELEAGWQRSLDRVGVPPALAAAAEQRFAREALFGRACGREVAALEEEADQASRDARPGAAERLLRRVVELEGGDPSPLRAAAQAWRAVGDLGRSESLLEEALPAERRRAPRAALLTALGDLRFLQGDVAGAGRRYRSALTEDPGPAAERALQARLVALQDRAGAAALGPFLLEEGDPGLALARLAQGEGGLARYLLGRARLACGAPRTALEDLAGLDPEKLPGAALPAEARRLWADALCQAGRFEDGIAAWGALAGAARLRGEGAAAEQAEDALRRCAFERDAYGEAVPMKGDWPLHASPQLTSPAQ